MSRQGNDTATGAFDRSRDNAPWVFPGADGEAPAGADGEFVGVPEGLGAPGVAVDDVGSGVLSPPELADPPEFPDPRAPPQPASTAASSTAVIVAYPARRPRRPAVPLC